MIIKLPSVAGNEPFAWAVENCPSFEKRTIVSPDGKKNPMVITRYCTLYYHFGSEQDAVLFTLKW